MELGVGGAFNYSEDENDLPPEGPFEPLLIRDNFRTRDARLDLAYGEADHGAGDRAGRSLPHADPLDRDDLGPADLRPQGGALTLSSRPQNSASRFALHGIYATGSHVFEDESRDVRRRPRSHLRVQPGLGLQLVGLLPPVRRPQQAAAAIHRQNTTRGAGSIANEYHVVDIVGRITRGGQLPLQLVGNYCWNTAVDVDNKGLWLSAVLGALGTSRARAEYIYAKIDKDATVAAFNTDDFFWGTGWEGHRARPRHGHGEEQLDPRHRPVAALQGQPGPAVREQWVTRYRLEWRTSF